MYSRPTSRSDQIPHSADKTTVLYGECGACDSVMSGTYRARQDLMGTAT